MSANPEEPMQAPETDNAQKYEPKLAYRHRKASLWKLFFQGSTVIAIVVLITLMLNVIDGVFGYIIVENSIDPASLAVAGVELEAMDKETLIVVFQENVSKGKFNYTNVQTPMGERSNGDIIDLIYEHVIEPQVVEQWSFYESLLQASTIKEIAAREYPDGKLEFSSWLDLAFLASPQDADAIKAGVRTAILGSLWVVSIAVLAAFPIGVGAAIYLEEYANKKNVINRIIQTNINNLAGVPSIIYGILGLAIFVRLLEPFTSGAMFGLTDPTTANGRTIISAGFTLGILILPLIIINSQEAIKAVSKSLKYASLALGATKWQTIWHHVLPSAASGILTGAILAISRAVGETAPLVVIGASTYITVDPDGPFSKFTTLPIQIYQWTSRPQDVFRNIAASGIIVLLLMLFTLNASAVYLRSRFGRRK